MAAPVANPTLAVESPSWPAIGLRTAQPGESGLGPPSALPRRLLFVGMLMVLAGLACLLSVVVRGTLVGFGDQVVSGDSLRLGTGLLLAGAFLAHAGSLFVRAD